MDTWGRFLCLFALAAASASAVTDKTLHRHAHHGSESSQEALLQEAFAFLSEKPKPLDPDAQLLWHQRKPTFKELATQVNSELADDDEVNAPNRAAENPLKDEPTHRVVLKRTKATKVVVPQASKAQVSGTVDSPQQVAKLDHAAGETRPVRSALPAAEKQPVEGKVTIPAHAPVHLAKETEEEQSKVKESVKAPEVDEPPTEEQLTQGATEPEEPDQQVEKPDRPVRSALPAVEKQPVKGKVTIPAHAPVHLAKETEEEQSKVKESVKAPEVDEPPTEEQLTQGATEPEEPDQQVEKPDLPFSELQPFGRRNVGESLTESSISQSNAMVDQLERAEVAEEKRAVFRSLTRLRGVALSSFDGVARSQTGNIEDYAEHHHWRSNHPVKHLAEEESDVKAWAFPANADFF